MVKVLTAAERRGIELHADSIESRIGTTVLAMAGHYRESVGMIEQRHPKCVFTPALRDKERQLGQLGGF
jgi:hypothetical protein